MKKYFIPSRVSTAQKLVLVPYFGLGAMLNPERGDLVAGLSDITAERALKQLQQNMLSTEQGKLILSRKPLICQNIFRNREFPADSLGWAYLNFMDEHGFSADDRSIVRFIENADLAYVMNRYRQVHDFWHVICGLPTNVLGELALKWFEYFHTKLPSCLLSGLFGPIRITFVEQVILTTKYIPWAKKCASSCENLLSYSYEDNLHKPVSIVRKELKITAAPKWSY